MEIISPEQIIAAAPMRPTALDSQIMANMMRPSSEDIPLCHFIPVQHFKTLLASRSVSLCRCDKFKDVADGLLPPPNQDEESPTMTRLYDELGSKAIDTGGRRIVFERDPSEECQQQEIARTITYVHCWFSGKSTDKVMWHEYGDESNAVCIESSSLSLLRAVAQPSTVEQLVCGKVSYSDGSQPIATAISYAPFFHKHERYAEEREVRLVAYLAPDPDTQQFDNTAERLAIPVDLSMLVHRVIVGSQVTETQRWRLPDLLQGSQPTHQSCVSPSQTTDAARQPLPHSRQKPLTGRTADGVPHHARTGEPPHFQSLLFQARSHGETRETSTKTVDGKGTRRAVLGGVLTFDTRFKAVVRDPRKPFS